MSLLEVRSHPNPSYVLVTPWPVSDVKRA